MGRASRVVFIAAFFLGITACSQAPHEPASQPSPTPAKQQHLPEVIASAAPAPPLSARPSQPPSVKSPPSPLASPSPPVPKLATAAPAPTRVERLPSGAPPQILDVAVSRTTVQPGDRVFGRVVTTSNVASVEARIGNYSVHLSKVGVGRFELSYTVGPLPWFIHGQYTMHVIARNVRGAAAMRDVSLTVR
jgi:hypothetical protein